MDIVSTLPTEVLLVIACTAASLGDAVRLLSTNRTLHRVLRDHRIEVTLGVLRKYQLSHGT